MINLQELLETWKKDCEIDTMNLDESSRLTPNLHAKYLEMHALAKLELKKAEHIQKTLLKKKFLYYNGKLSKEDIEREKWDFDPFDGLKILKSDLGYYYEGDEEIQRSEERIEYWNTVIMTLKEILDNIRWRSQTIRNMVEYRKFMAGG